MITKRHTSGIAVVRRRGQINIRSGSAAVAPDRGCTARYVDLGGAVAEQALVDSVVDNLWLTCFGLFLVRLPASHPALPRSWPSSYPRLHLDELANPLDIAPSDELSLAGRSE